MKTVRILIIAGSDSSGGAGIQADIKTVTMLGGHAMTAITAVTAQNTRGVSGVHPIPAQMVLDQIEACVSDIGVDAIKIGMIGSAETAMSVARYLRKLTKNSESPTQNPKILSLSKDVSRSRKTSFDKLGTDGEGESKDLIPIVFDPVMVASSGAVLADEVTIAAFRQLMRISSVVTPNVIELERLTGMSAQSVEERKFASGELQREYGCAVLSKGGHGIDVEGRLSDLLTVDHGTFEYFHDRIETAHTHGTGCTLASALAMGLGQHMALEDATERAIDFVHAALREAIGLGQGNGPINQGLSMTPFYDYLERLNPDGFDAVAYAARWASRQ